MFFGKKETVEHYVDQEEYSKFLNEVADELGGDKWKNAMASVSPIQWAVTLLYLQDVSAKDCAELINKKFPLKQKELK